MQKKNNALFTIIIVLLCSMIVVFLLIIYFRHIEEETKRLLEKTDASLVASEPIITKSGLFEVNIENDVMKYLDKKEINTITYEMPGEQIYFEIMIDVTGDKYTFSIDKMVDKYHDVKAKIRLENIKRIEYRTGNINKATLLNFITENNSEYLAITGNTYYFLGSDIESISYMNDHLYYVSYNNNYRLLDDATSCNKEIKSSIDGFNQNDYYYKYGKINFLNDYYQKLASKTYTVKDRCKELENTPM